MAEAVRRGSEHHAWKGDAVGYSALHRWIRTHKVMPAACAHCRRTDRRLEWANVSHEYRRDLDDWMALCRPCHRAFDFPNHCKRGHEWTEANTITKANQRTCRACYNATRRRWYAKRRSLEVAQ